MSRTIKFRAWDRDSSEMYYSKELIGAIDFYLDFNDKGLALWLHVDDEAPEKRDAVIMQFTGLHDKNGKEIYEGDVVRQFGLLWKVVFIKGCFGIEGLDISSIHRQVDEDVEIIGNIYENKELLDNK